MFGSPSCQLLLAGELAVAFGRWLADSRIGWWHNQTHAHSKLNDCVTFAFVRFSIAINPKCWQIIFLVLFILGWHESLKKGHKRGANIMEIFTIIKANTHILIIWINRNKRILLFFSCNWSMYAEFVNFYMYVCISYNKGEILLFRCLMQSLPLFRNCFNLSISNYLRCFSIVNFNLKIGNKFKIKNFVISIIFFVNFIFFFS